VVNMPGVIPDIVSNIRPIRTDLKRHSHESLRAWLDRVEKASVEGHEDVTAFIPFEMHPTQQDRLDNLLTQYDDIFAKNEFDIGSVPKDIVEHRFRLYEDTPLKSARPEIKTGTQWSNWA
jgi:hypothetical protein